MLVEFDGVTPVPRLMLISEFRLRSDFHVELDRPAFVAEGDRLSIEDGHLVVTGPTGERRTYGHGNSHWICGRWTASQPSGAAEGRPPALPM
ncbi:hypothetical protein [Kitasatospora sp. NPDC085879]|uniref:hypothetical protein n=1 Tax=Kitasatospora sp. NPDC085879 TaxID=3154769 RepID=UPI003434BB40